MQVTHAADHITHAVMGGHKTIEFSISNNAAFFQILSSTLYSDQRLAVAREVLCNAWDAHIRAGITDKPIQVNISEEKIVVLDKAFGIAPDMMGPLYGTYGGTDKTNNGTETGGFGLGCKAPFAYTDHFEVVSCHLGTRTIYNVSKSSADKLGKPGITPIVSVPTMETGLQVTVPLKMASDRHVFLILFDTVARNGEMNVEINGSPVQGIPFSKAQSNWLITTKSLVSTKERMLIRYGNVIYPMPYHVDYANAHRVVTEFLDSLTGRYSHGSYKIVFQAEPNTISVTPSRESLSMQEHTIKTIQGLLEGFCGEWLHEAIGKESETLLEQQIKKVTEARQIGELMRHTTIIPGFSSMESEPDLEYIGTINELTSQYTRRIYPKAPEFYRKDMGLRIDAALSLGIGHRGHLQTIKRQIITPEHKLGKLRTTESGRKYRAQLIPYAWFKRKVLRPLYRDLAANPALEAGRLFVASNHYSTDHLRNPVHMNLINFGEYLPLLRKVIVISYVKKDIWTKIRYNKEVMEAGGPEHVWYYHAPVSRKRIPIIREFFASRGFTLVDFTSEDNWDKYKRPSTYVPVAERKAKPKSVGYPALKGVIREDKPNRVDNCFLPDTPHIDNPKFYLKIEFSRAEHRDFTIGNFDRHISRTIVKLFGDECAVVRTEPQATKFKEAGLPEFNDYVIGYVCDKVTNSPGFLAYWPECINRGFEPKNGANNGQLMTTLFDIAEVRSIMGLTTSLDEHEFMVLNLWRSMMDYRVSFRDERFPKIAAAEKLITAMPVSKVVSDIAEKANKTEFTDLLSFHTIHEIAKRPNAQLDGQLDLLAKLTHALLG
jgi:hypothetical protein